MQHGNSDEKTGEASSMSTTPYILSKQGDGTSYAPWLLAMKNRLLDTSNSFVSSYGAQILTDQERFEAPLHDRLKEVEGEEKKAILKVREGFINATHAVFNIIEKNISPELRELVQADEDYRNELKNPRVWESRPVHKLLALLRKHVTSDVTADPTFQTMLSLQGLHMIKQDAAESTRAYADRIKDAMLRFETGSPHGRLFRMPDIKINRQLLGAGEERSATRASSSRDPPSQTTSQVTVQAEDLRDVIVPDRGWITDEYVVRLAIMNMNARNEGLRAEWIKRLTDGKSGQETPRDLEDFVNQVAIRESMQGVISGQQVNDVKITVKSSENGSKRQRGADGDSDQKHAKTKCHYCGNLGHLQKQCRKKKRDDKASKEQDKDKDNGKDDKKGGNSSPQGEVMVTESQSAGDDGGYVDPREIFNTILVTEEVDAEDVSIYASSANTTTHEYEFPPAAVKDEIILYDSCANLSIIRNPYL